MQEKGDGKDGVREEVGVMDERGTVLEERRF